MTAISKDDINTLKYLTKGLHFEVGSFDKVITVKNDKGELHKEFEGLPTKWTTTTPELKIKQGQQGFFVKTGKGSNIVAIDIDNPDNPELEELIAMCEEQSNFIVRTRKGKHYYFKFNPLLKNTNSKVIGMDTRSDGGMLICPPTKYMYEDDEIEYEIARQPEELDELNELTAEMTDYMVKKWGSKFINIPEEKKEKKEKKEEIKEEIKEEPKEEPKEEDNSNPERELLLKALNNVNIDRFTNYDSWFQFGAICYNERTLLSFDDFVYYSKKAPNYVDERDCSKKWKEYKQNNCNKISKATVWKWLKEDNFEVFKQLVAVSNDMWEFIRLMNDNDASKLFYNNYPTKFLYNIKLGWFSLQNNNIWKSYGNKYPINMTKMINDFFQQFIKDFKKAELKRYTDLIENTFDREKEKKIIDGHEERLKVIDKQYRIAGSFKFATDVSKLLLSLYNNDDLDKIIDFNRDLIAFEDKVYVISTGEVRDIKPDDYISTTTGYKFPLQSNKSVRDDIEKTIKSMFPDDDTYEYMLYTIASSLLNYNKYEKFYIWTGRGGNGKGLLTTLVQKAFGNHYIAVSNSLFTQKNKSKDAPLNEVVDSRSKKMMMTTEPESSEYLQVGIIKQFTGNDDLQARKCHKDEVVSFKPMFVLFLQTNNIPKLNNIDEGIQRRLTIINFPYQFRANPDGNNPLEKQGDSKIKVKFSDDNDYRDEFMLMLLEKLKELNKKDDKEFDKLVPKNVLDTTREFIDECNLIKDWLFTNIELTYNNKDTIGIRETYEAYKSYMYKNQCLAIPEKLFKNLMKYNNIQHKRTTEGERYIGIKLKVDTEVKEEPKEEGEECKIRDELD